ncbi:MAG: SPOR domain-containing protein [Treponema sp.]|nr:SPOR domain-containing protein [Treponema sp.]
MKNKIQIIFAVVIGCLMFASFSPSLDGRAVVADEGTFPEGLFAKTVGYLPGDSITVSNLSTKKTIDILVVGALDPSEGVAILLSPEAAFALGIEKNSNSIVKITKRSGQLDEAVSGTAVIAEGTAAAPSDSAQTTAADTAAAETTEPPADSPSDNTTETAGAPGAETADAGAAPAQPEKTADESDAETISATEAPVQPESAGSETESVTSGDETAGETTPAAGEKIDEETPSPEETAENSGGTPETSADGTTPPAGEIINEKAPSEETAAVPPAAEPENTDDGMPGESEEKVNDKIPETTASSAVPVSEAAVDDKEAETETAAGEKVDENIPSAEETPEKTSDAPAGEDTVAAEPYVEKPDEKPSEDVSVPAEKVDEHPAAEEKTTAAAEPVPDESVTENTPSPVENKVAEPDAYAPIILVPAEPNPPESDKGTPETKAAEEASAVPENTAGETAPGDAPSEGEFDKYTVPSLKALSSGRYYIQIGVYADEANIRKVVRKYAGAYPVTIVPLVSGKAKQLMIGPLSVDEYAAVIERFKSYGYKDAFLRKIK